MDKKQAEMKEQIAEYMRKKDYYDILGIQKNATQTDIKKNYKKLALRFHPDKNSVQGAKEVFKKVSNAYSNLSNLQLRERYDRYGPQQQQQVRYRQQRHQGHNNNGDQQFDEFDQLFRAFFGGGLGQNVRMNGNGGNFRTYRYNFGGGHEAHAQNPQQQRQNGNQFNLSYFFIIIFIFYIVGPLFKSKPYYSFTANTQYRFKVSTDLLGTPYFVRQQFFAQAAKSLAFKKEIDIKIDFQHMSDLSNRCDHATRTKKRFQYNAYQYNPGQYRNYYLSESNKVDMSSCKRMRDLQSNFPEYLSQLYSY